MTPTEYIEFTKIGRGAWKKEMDEDLKSGFFNGMSKGPGGEFADYVISRGLDFDREAREEIKELFPRIQKEIDLRSAKAQDLLLGEAVTPNEVPGPTATPIAPEEVSDSLVDQLGGK